MQKEINLQGIQRNSPDNKTPDGTCQEIVNLRYDSGAWRPVGSKKRWTNAAYGANFFVHVVGEYKNKISKLNDKIYWSKMVGYPNINPTETLIATVGVNDVVRFDTIGNVLVIFNETQQKIAWAIWSPEKQGAVLIDKYDYIDKLPELPIFSFKTEEKGDIKYGEFAYEGASPETIAEKQEFVKNQTNAFMAKKRSEWYEKGWFDGYVYLVYAFELFDGSVIKHSNPICLYGGNRRMLDDEVGSNLQFDEPFVMHLFVRYSGNMEIKCRNVIASQLIIKLQEATNLSAYKQLIRSINIYITPPVNIDLSDNVPSHRASLPAHTFYPTYYKTDKLPSLNFDKQAGFYLLKKIGIEDVSKYLNGKELAENLNGLAAKPALPVDNSTHHQIYADANITYNSRLFMGDIFTRLFSGWGLKYYNNAGNSTEVFTRVILHTADGIKTVDSEPFKLGDRLNFPLIVSYPDARAVRMDFFSVEGEPFGRFLFIEEGIKPRLSIPLTVHPTLNIAYAINPNVSNDKGANALGMVHAALTMCKDEYFTNSLTKYSFGSFPNDVIRFNSNTLVEINRIQLSELSNPFYFPAKNSEYVGARVLGFSANTIPLSQGQFGQHPMFVFTQQGMWAMSIGVSPFIQSITPVNGEVVSDKRRIVNIGEATIFKTGEGLKMAEGSQVVNLSDSIKLLDNALLASPDCGLSHVTTSNVLGNNETFISKETFLKYLENACIGYDSTHRELFISNPAYKYSYVLSMKHNYWYKVSYSGRYIFADYPSFYLVQNNDLLELNNETSSNQCVFLQTRPIDLETHGFKKALRTILRGCFGYQVKLNQLFGMYLFVSVDGKQWKVIGGKEVKGMVRDIILRNQYPSVKFLTVVASGVLTSDSFLSSITFDGEARLTEQLR